MGDVERAIAESVKQKELLEKTREEAQKNQQALDIAQTNLENSKKQVSESDLYNGQIGGGVQNNTSVENINQTNMNTGFVQPEVVVNQNAQPVGGQSVTPQGTENSNVQSVVGQNTTVQGTENLNAEATGQNVNQGQMGTQYTEPVGQPSQPYNATQQVAPNQYAQPQVAQGQVVQPEVQPQVQPAGQFGQPNNVAQTVQNNNVQPYNATQQVAPNQYAQSQVVPNQVVQPQVAPNQVVQPEQPTGGNNTQPNNFN